MFAQGEHHDGIFIIQRGVVRVFYVVPSGREITLAYWTADISSAAPRSQVVAFPCGPLQPSKIRGMWHCRAQPPRGSWRRCLTSRSRCKRQMLFFDGANAGYARRSKARRNISSIYQRSMALEAMKQTERLRSSADLPGHWRRTRCAAANYKTPWCTICIYSCDAPRKGLESHVALDCRISDGVQTI